MEIGNKRERCQDMMKKFCFFCPPACTETQDAVRGEMKIILKGLE